MMCPLCGQRKARRACPALGQQICAVCCGTKRLTQIRCPSDCVYLASSREHPPAAAVRQQQRDIALIVQFMRDFSEHQSNLFLMVSTFLARYVPADLESIVDDDVTEATAAMASTFETASRGVIYEHRPASLPAERLLSRLKPLIVEAGQRAGATFERDAAFVLRRVAEAAVDARTAEPANRRAFLDLLGRVVRKTGSEPGAEPESAAAKRLIVP